MKSIHYSVMIFICIATLMIACTAASADSKVSNQPNDPTDFNYVIRGDHVEIASYVGKSQIVIIPETIEGYPVTVVKLGKSDYEEIPGFFPYITKVVLPSTVQCLKDNCFGWLELLNEIEGLEYVQELGNSIFNRCSSLTQAHFSTNLVKVGEYAFQGSYMGLKSIWIPDDIDLTSNIFFLLPETLTELKLISGNSDAKIIINDDMLLSADVKTLIRVLPYRKKALCVIPEGTVICDEYAFYPQMYLCEVQFPASLELMHPNSINTDLVYYAYDDSYAYEYITENVQDACVVSISSENKEQMISEYVNNIINEYIDEDMTDYQKARALHDWLIEHASYDYTLEKSNAIDIFRDGKGVCDAYVKAYSILLDAANIGSLRVTCILGDTSHAINAVQIDNKWYLVDCTNDDEGFGRGNRLFCFDNTVFKAYYRGALPVDANDISLFAPYYDGILDAAIQELTYEIEQCVNNAENTFTASLASTDVDEICGYALSGLFSRKEWGASKATLSCDYMGVTQDGLNQFYFQQDSVDVLPYKYYVENGGIWITKYTGDDTIVTIPETIDGLPVICLVGAFNLNDKIVEVHLPEGLIRISNETFQGCSKLTKVYFPSSLERIDEKAFFCCYSLGPNVVLPDGLKSIGTMAFATCASLRSISLPGTITSIGHNTFSGCSVLENVHLGEGITTLSDSMFFECTSLKHITLPDSLQKIDRGAFLKSSLVSIYIPRNVTVIEWGAFTKLSYFEKITVAQDNPCFCAVDNVLYTKDMRTLIMAVGDNFPLAYHVLDSVTEIGELAFTLNETIKDLYIPSSVHIIRKGAFFNTQIENVYIEEGLETIEDLAFGAGQSAPGITFAIWNRINNLHSIKLPNTLKTIGEGAFCGNEKLTVLEIPRSVTRIDTSIISYPQVMIVPETVEFIAQQQFDDTRGENIIYGVPGTYAEEYAGQYGYTFVSMAKKLYLKATFDELIVEESGQLSVSSISDTYSNIDISDVNWTIEPAIVEITNGIVKAIAPGDVTIKAQYGDFIGELSFHVYDMFDEGQVSIGYMGSSGGFGEIWVGDSKQLIFNGLLDWSVPYSSHCIWSVSDDNVIKISQYGYMSAIGPGECTVYASFPNGIVLTFKFLIHGQGFRDESEADQILKSLHTVTLPASLKTVESEAFYCTSFESVILPEGCVEVCSYAFGGSSSLRAVLLPASITWIDDTAFNGSEAIVLIVSNDYARHFAIENGIDFIENR